MEPWQVIVIIVIYDIAKTTCNLLLNYESSSTVSETEETDETEEIDDVLDKIEIDLNAAMYDIHNIIEKYKTESEK